MTSRRAPRLRRGSDEAQPGCGSQQRSQFCSRLELSPAAAQDMSFDMEETEGAAPAAKPGKGAPAKVEKSAPKPPPEEGPPSAVLASALKLYQDERHQELPVQLQRIVEGETPDTPGNQQKAQFFLGKSLYHLGYYQSALAIFDEISAAWARGTSSSIRRLQWLAQLASQLPEPAGIIEKVGRYGSSIRSSSSTTPRASRSVRPAALFAGPLQVRPGRVRAGHRAVREGSHELQVVRAAPRMSSRASRYVRLRKAQPGCDPGVPRDHRSASKRVTLDEPRSRIA